MPEVAPAREVLAESRTLNGGGAACIATVGAASVEVAQDVFAETQSAILPLVPYLGTLRWVFIAMALFGIAVAIHARIDDWKQGHRYCIGTSPSLPATQLAKRLASCWPPPTIALFLLNLRRAGERAGRLADHMRDVFTRPLRRPAQSRMASLRATGPVSRHPIRRIRNA